MNSEAIKYSYRAIINYPGRNYEEYERLVKTAVQINKDEEDLTNCKYKINGNYVPAKVNFRTGEIFIDGAIVKRGYTVCTA